MNISPLAGKPATTLPRVDVPRLVTAYYTTDAGSRGAGAGGGFWHLRSSGFGPRPDVQRGPRPGDQPGDLRVPPRRVLTAPCSSASIRTRSRSGLRQRARGACGERRRVMLAKDDEYTPTPVLSHAILTYNRGRTSGLADGIVVTPSHNPPTDGGFKYNPPNGGPAESDVTGRIESARTSIWKAGLRQRQADALRGGAACRDDPSS